ncbi:hypothetical protein MAP00_001953 [Monascus purpureus]|nr:hypothetical protein MAP00_001953 [Monascus purpureus]
MVQTPQQRKANEKYARREVAKRGKGQIPPKQKQKPKAPVSMGWIAILAFVICGGLIFELMRIIPELWTVITSVFGHWTT